MFRQFYEINGLILMTGRLYILYIVAFSSPSSLCNWLNLCLACVHLQKQKRASQKDSKIQFCHPTEKDMVQGNIQGAKTVNLEKSGGKNGTRIKNSEKRPGKLHLLLLLVREINSACMREKRTTSITPYSWLSCASDLDPSLSQHQAPSEIHNYQV